MRAILIDPFAETVSAIHFTGNFQDIYKLINCTCFTPVSIRQGETMWVDDEGMFKSGQRFFRWIDREGYLAGRALLLGESADGEPSDTNWTVQEVQAFVEWAPKIRYVGMEQSERRGPTPFGPGTIITRKAIFGTEN